MKKLIKVISALLAVLMFAGALSISASAAIPLLTDQNERPDYSDTINAYLGSTSAKDYNNSDNAKEDKHVIYSTPEEKLHSMASAPMWETEDYELWADEITGEVATVKKSTGEILFTNPWDLQNGSFSNGNNKITTSLSTKQKLLSQIVINYDDNGAAKTFYSCKEAAMKNQISVDYITNGIRVEYSIGNEETRMLVPMLIEKTRYETKILLPMRRYINNEITTFITDRLKENSKGELCEANRNIYPVGDLYEEYPYYDLVLMNKPDFDMAGPCDPVYDEFNVGKVDAFYTERDPDKAQTDSERDQMYAAYPITRQMAVYVFDPNASSTQKASVERRIKEYCPSYTYDELDYDHAMTNYKGTDKQPALFKMAIEYTLDKDGLIVRQPANGIRFDQSLYKLNYFELLPYMGAGEADGDTTDGGDGYTFFPDGSGALFDFDLVLTKRHNGLTRKVYGQDFAYHRITGGTQEEIRYPVFGIVQKGEAQKEVTDYSNVIKDAVKDIDGNVISETVYGTKIETVTRDSGFLAIIEEGDALAELEDSHMGNETIYNTIKMKFYPRPKDEYNMADAISVGANTTMVVESDRRYVGSYRVRYIMLTDDKLAEENNLSSYYECSWMGMAVAYRDYLVNQGVLNRLEENDVDDDIPLYIETLGSLWTTEKILSLPVDLMTPLTTFEDIKTMFSGRGSAAEDDFEKTGLKDEIEKKMQNLVEAGKANGTTAESAGSFSNLNFKLTGFANGGLTSTVPYHLNWESANGGASGFRKLLEDSKAEGYDLFPDFDFVYINAEDTFDGVYLKNDAVKTIDNRYTGRRVYSATLQANQGYFGLAIAPSRFERFVTKLTNNYMKYSPTGISVSTFGTDLNSDFDKEDPLNREDSKNFTIKALEQLASLTNKEGNKVKVMTDGANEYAWKYIDYIVNTPLNSSRYNFSKNAVPFIGVVLHGYKQFAGNPINQEGDIEFAFLKAIENGASIYFTLAFRNYEKLKEYSTLSKYYSVRYDIWKDDIVDYYVELNDLLCDLQTKLIIDHDFLVANRIGDPEELAEDAENIRKENDLAQAAKIIEEIKASLKEMLDLRHTSTNSIESIEKSLNEINVRVVSLASSVAAIDHSYIDSCFATITAVKGIEAAVESAKSVTFNGAAYDYAVEEVKSSLKNVLLTELGVKINDENANAVIDKVIDTVIDVTAVNIVNAAVEMNNDKPFASTKKMNESADAKTSGVATAVYNDLVAKQSLFTLSASETVIYGKICNAVKSCLENDAAKSGAMTAFNAYNRNIETAELKFNKAVGYFVEVKSLIQEAENAGVSTTVAENLYQYEKENAELKNKLAGIGNSKAQMLTLINDSEKLINNYYTALLTYVNSSSFRDKDGNTVSQAIKNDISKIKSYYNRLDIYELYDGVRVNQVGVEEIIDDAKYADAKAKLNTAEEAYIGVNEAAKAVYNDLVNAIATKANNAESLYAELIALNAQTFATKEANYVNRIKGLTIYTKEEKAAMLEAAKLINAKDKCDDIMKITAAYVNAYTNDKNANAVIADLMAKAAKENADSEVSVIDAEIARITNKQITISGELDKVSTTQNRYKLSYLELIGLYTTKVNVNQVKYNDIKATVVAEVKQVPTVNAQIEANNNSINALFTASEALVNAKNAYNAVAENDAIANADGIINLIEDVYRKQIINDTVKSNRDLYEQIISTTYGIAPADKAEKDRLDKEFITVKKDYESAMNALTNARDKSAHKAEFVAVEAAFANDYNAIRTIRNIINLAVDVKAQVSGVSESVFDNSISATTERTQIANAVKASIENANSEYNSIKSLYENAKNELIKSYNAVYSNDTELKTWFNGYGESYLGNDAAHLSLESRLISTVNDYNESDWFARVYETAVIAINYSVAEVKAFSADNAMFRDAYTAMTNDLETLKARAIDSGDERSEDSFVYSVALAVAEHSREGISALCESYKAQKTTALREMNNAERFFNVGKNEVDLVKENFEAIKAKYDEALLAYNTNDVLSANVLVLGDTTLATIRANAVKDILFINDSFDSFISLTEKAENYWAVIEEAGEEYRIAEANGDEAQKQIAIIKIDTAKEAILSMQGISASFRKQFVNVKDTVAKLESYKTEIESFAEKAKNLADVPGIGSDARTLATDAYNKAIEIKNMLEANLAVYLADATDPFSFNAVCARTVAIGMIAYSESKGSLDVQSTNAMLTDKVNAIYNSAADETNEIASKYLCNDGSVVAVTYGGKDGNDNTPYRTFILNFNSFGVTVEYEGTTYTIGNYSYAVINH